MTSTLNVLITLTGGEKVFSVLSEPIPAITGLDLAVSAGFTITDAVDDWYDRLPPYFFIDDENILYKELLPASVHLDGAAVHEVGHLSVGELGRHGMVLHDYFLRDPVLLLQVIPVDFVQSVLNVVR